MGSSLRAFWENGTRMLDFGDGKPVAADEGAMKRAREVAKLKAVPLGLAASFGYGDRIGLATPGHVAADGEKASEKGKGILPDVCAAVDPGDGAHEPGAAGGDG